MRGDDSLLHSAVENVVRNAIRYTQEGSSVEIELTSEKAEGRGRGRVAGQRLGAWSSGGFAGEDVRALLPAGRCARAADGWSWVGTGDHGASGALPRWKGYGFESCRRVG